MSLAELIPILQSLPRAEKLQVVQLLTTELAQEELETWELSTMRDPRNWVRPVAATVIGAIAGTALVVLRVRGRHRTRRQQSSRIPPNSCRTETPLGYP